MALADVVATVITGNDHSIVRDVLLREQRGMRAHKGRQLGTSRVARHTTGFVLVSPGPFP